MLPILGWINYEIQKKTIERKNFIFPFINCTYLDISLGCSHSSKFLAPADLNKKMLDSNKKV
jgi:hypothetical protein